MPNIIESANQAVEFVELNKGQIDEAVTICPKFTIGGLDYTCVVFNVPILVASTENGPVYRKELRGPVIVPLDKIKEPTIIEGVNA